MSNNLQINSLTNKDSHRIPPKQLKDSLASSRTPLTTSFLNGLLLVDKPTQWTSHDLVAKIRQIFKTKSVGHSGTLDPLASGLMVLLLGEATKLSQYILEKDKSYIVKIQLGLRTDTLDITGKTLKIENLDGITPELVKATSLSLSGEMELEVPLYSAVKIQGKKLYEYARKGEEVVLPKKEMKFYDLEVLDQGSDWIKISLSCSKGSYVRAWAALLGEKLNCGACMSELVRTRSSPYSLKDAITIDELETSVQLQNLLTSSSSFIPLYQTLPQYKSLRIEGQDEVMILNGQISYSLKNQLISLFNPDHDEGVKILSRHSGHLLALIGLESEKGFVIKRGFRY